MPKTDYHVSNERRSAIVERIRKGAPHGLSFGMFHSDRDAIIELDTALEFSEPIPEQDRRDIILRAIHAVFVAKTFDSGTLLKRVKEQETRYLARPLKPFLVATSVTMAPPREPLIRHVDGIRIRIAATHSAAILAARKEVDPPIGDEDLAPVGSAAVQIRLRARSVYHALQTGIDAFDLLRGYWNYAINARIYRASRGGETPVNTISIGRIHTVHSPTGKTAFHTYFYQQGAPVASWRYEGDPPFTELIRVEQVMRRRMARAKYRADLERVIVRYVRALDSLDASWVFVRLWGVLERLTGTERRHDETVKRAAFVWTEPAIAGAMLDHLRERRNALVHHGLESDSAIALVYQVKGYVEALIHFHLRSRGRFSALAEVAEYLDLPPDPKRLDKLLSLHRRAHSFRKASAKDQSPIPPGPVSTAS